MDDAMAAQATADSCMPEARTTVSFRRLVVADVVLVAVAVVLAASVLVDSNGAAAERVLAVLLLVACVVGAVALAGMRIARHRALCDVAEARWRLSVHDELPGRVLWETTADGTITHVGPGSVQLLGFHPAEVVGRSLAAVLPARELPRASELLSRSVREGTGWTDERYTYVTRSGEERDLYSSALIHLGPDRRPMGFTGILREIDVETEVSQELAAVRQQVAWIIEREALRIVFQPIAESGTGVIVGAEALSRFTADPPRPPDEWFAAAADIGRSVDLELVAVRAALREARHLPAGLYVSVNLSPPALVDDALDDALERSAWPLDRLVVEITEHVSVTDYDHLGRAIERLRSRGVRLAVDDAGAGYASFRHILNLRPDVIKLDRTLVDGIHDNPAKRALAGAVVAFGREVGASVVAEGIETADELRAARALGVQHAQGYFIGRPAPPDRVWGSAAENGALSTALP